MRLLSIDLQRNICSILNTWTEQYDGILHTWRQGTVPSLRGQRIPIRVSASWRG